MLLRVYGHNLRVNQVVSQQPFIEKRLHLLNCIVAHWIKLEMRLVSWAVACDQKLRKLTLTIGTSHVLMKGHKLLLLALRMTALSSSNFPQAPKGMETLTQMPGLGNRTSGEQTIILPFLSLAI